MKRSRFFFFDVVPVAKGRVRLSPRTGGIYTPQKTRDAQETIQELAALDTEHDAPLSGPLQGSFLFLYSSPLVRKIRVVKTTKPDVTNLVKLVEDALLPVIDRRTRAELWQGIYHDDSQIIWEHTAKMYCWTPTIRRGIYVRLTEMDDSDLDDLVRWAETLIQGGK